MCENNGYVYSGLTWPDWRNLRCPGCLFQPLALITWRTRDLIQSFEGPTTNGILNGCGTYRIDDCAGNKVFEGLLRVNDFEGYGQLSFNDNCSFYGLFKDSLPYGPGVYTDAEMNQQVGFWDGNRLVRTIKRIKNKIPKLGVTPKARKLLARYKKVIVYNKEYINSLLQDEVDKLNGYEGIVEDLKLYQNTYIKESLFFDGTGYSTTNQCWTSDESCPEENRIYSVYPCDPCNQYQTLLIGANSTPYMQTMFPLLYRYNSDARSDIHNILYGRRKKFYEYHKNEFANLTFLALCAKKRPEFEVLNFFMANPIDINVTDIDGNFGLLMATARNQHDLMKTLLELGADINKLNDEGFSSLTLALSAYITFRNEDRICWYHSFLNEEKNLDFLIWAKCFATEFDEESDFDDGFLNDGDGDDEGNDMGIMSEAESRQLVHCYGKDQCICLNCSLVRRKLMRERFERELADEMTPAFIHGEGEEDQSLLEDDGSMCPCQLARKPQEQYIFDDPVKKCYEYFNDFTKTKKKQKRQSQRISIIEKEIDPEKRSTLLETIKVLVNRNPDLYSSEIPLCATVLALYVDDIIALAIIMKSNLCLLKEKALISDELYDALSRMQIGLNKVFNRSANDLLDTKLSMKQIGLKMKSFLKAPKSKRRKTAGKKY